MSIRIGRRLKYPEISKYLTFRVLRILTSTSSTQSSASSGNNQNNSQTDNSVPSDGNQNDSQPTLDSNESGSSHEVVDFSSNHEFVSYPSAGRDLMPVLEVSKLKVSDMYVISKENQEQYSNEFQSFVTRNGMTKFPDTQYKWLKSEESQKFLLSRSEYVFEYWNIWYYFYKHYVHYNLVFIRKLKPISKYHINNLDLSIRAHDALSNEQTSGVGVSNLVFSRICPLVDSFVGYSVYGSSLLASDLLLFTSPPYRKMALSVSIVNNSFELSSVELFYSYPNQKVTLLDGSVTKSESIEYKHTDTSTFVASFDYSHMAKISDVSSRFNFNHNNSSFYKNSFSVLFNKLYSFECHNRYPDCKDPLTVEFSYTSESASMRTSTTTRNEKGEFQVFSGGFTTHNVVTYNSKIVIRDEYIIQFFLVLFMLPDLKLSQTENIDIIRYVMSLIISYLLSQVLNKNKIDLISMSFNFNLLFNKNNVLSQSELDDIFRNYVDSGDFIPLTPLHYHYYINKSFKRSDWFKIIMFSSLLFPGFTNTIKTVLPYIDIDSKDKFHLYANNHNYLKSSFYGSKNSITSAYNQVNISFDDFMKELAIRNYTLDSFIPNIKLVSKGEWKGFSASSMKISMPYLNRYFLKFSIISRNDIVEYISGLSLYEAKDKPSYIRGSVRCVESLPDVFSRQLDDMDDNYQDDDSN